MPFLTGQRVSSFQLYQYHLVRLIFQKMDSHLDATSMLLVAHKNKKWRNQERFVDHAFH
jgi:hypothetical protein